MNSIKKFKNAIRDENGLVIVEATIVFPIMFFVLFFILFIGSMYYEQARIDSIVSKYAVKGASYVANPELYDLDHGNPLPTHADEVDTEPYRYILGKFTKGSIYQIEDKISKKVKEEIIEGSSLFFSNQKINLLGSDNSKIATYKTYVVYSVFIVQVNYEIKFPMRFIFDNNPTVVKLSSRAEVAVNDCPEFIRNVDMVVDLLDGTTVSEKIKDIFEKINGFIGKFSGN